MRVLLLWLIHMFGLFKFFVLIFSKFMRCDLPVVPSDDIYVADSVAGLPPAGQ